MTWPLLILLLLALQTASHVQCGAGPGGLCPPGAASVGLRTGLPERLAGQVIEGAVHRAVHADQQMLEFRYGVDIILLPLLSGLLTSLMRPLLILLLPPRAA